MAASNHSWTIGDTGCGNGPSGENDHLPGGQIDVQMSLEARQDVPWEYDFKKQSDISFAPNRVDVPTGLETYGVPAPFAGDPGQPIDFAAVAPDFEEPNAHDLDGSGAPGTSIRATFPA